MKKVLTLAAAILTGAAITATAATPSKPPGFQDMTDHWAFTSVQQAVVKGYVDGYEDGSFRPDEQVTRAEFIKMTVTALNESVGGADGGSWYSPYLQTAINASILTWGDFDYGDWNTPITREQMAKIAVRAIGQKA
ncbi:S-layer homology domain-containing protein, partial [Paenibacillus sp. y28]|uniref:S-layer homology domain-containing protein n=1 Tax=Paenibacillus sp. y28 TaxID=3129110 RepID=UPI00301877AB